VLVEHDIWIVVTLEQITKLVDQPARIRHAIFVHGSTERVELRSDIGRSSRITEDALEDPVRVASPRLAFERVQLKLREQPDAPCVNRRKNLGGSAW
jgi:hypothetical protein